MCAPRACLIVACLTTLLLAAPPADAQRFRTDNAEVTLHLTNATGAPVQVYWLNFSGEEQDYGVLEPDMTWQQGTFATHEWRFRQEGRLLMTYVATDEPRQHVTVRTAPLRELKPPAFVARPPYPSIERGDNEVRLPYRPLTLWTRQPVYDLDRNPAFSVTFDALLDDPRQELIIAFSENRIPWGIPGADALTLRASPSDQDFWFRTNFYEGWLDAWLNFESGEEVMRAGQWQHYELILTGTTFKVMIDGRQVAEASLRRANIPRSGHVGLVVFGHEALGGTTIAFRNVAVSDHFGDALVETAPAPALVRDAPVPLPLDRLEALPAVAGIEATADGFSLPYRPLYLWTGRPVYDLDAAAAFTLAFEARLDDPRQELIVAFSESRRPWGDPEADALTFRTAPTDQGFWFRTGFYAEGLDAWLDFEEGEEIVRAGQWQHYEVTLTPRAVAVSVDGRPVAQASLEGTPLAPRGYAGFVVYGNEALDGTRLAFRNVRYVTAREADLAVVSPGPPLPEDEPEVDPDEPPEDPAPLDLTGAEPPQPVAVTFVNTASAPLDLFWVDEAGVEHEYGVVPKDSIRVQETLPTHTWRLKLLDELIDTYEAGTGASQVHLIKPPPPDLLARATATRDFESETTRDDAVDPAAVGKYYAFVIGVQDYTSDAINDLTYPLQDAQNLINTLTEHFTFEQEDIVFLKNPKKDDIMNELDRLAQTVTARDNLLIFYAGHGTWDDRMEQGFWLPADAEKERRSKWVSNNTLQTYLKGIPARHTLLISDACFSGGIFRTRDAFSTADRAIRELYKIPSRQAMTSGTLTVVPDKSIFVHYLLKTLRESDAAFLTARAVFDRLQEPVISNAPPELQATVPQYGVVQGTGHEGGEFVFIRRQ
ncbi:caspase family protein [Rhodocaloribacter litoris]|uniref:caspase family protein n=1 Tax=Rhodocaloribacter litoris TaxID=2558931 RepID=UPI00141F3D28|nr:caspase family protein [Rhodocaloribacter litoris]QXD16139.1 caspase family protein [Rhodocaloribacter litoris]